MDKNRSNFELITVKPNWCFGAADGFEKIFEYRIFMGMMHHAYMKRDITKEFDLDARTILGENANRGNNYKYLKEACRSIVSRAINVLSDTAQGFDYRNIVSRASFSLLDKTGKIMVAFNPMLTPMIVELFEKGGGGYTKMLMKYTMLIRSLYSIRLFEYLLKNRYKEKTIVSIEALRVIIGVPKGAYSEWYEFNRNIILVAQKSLKKHTNIAFKYKGIRIGRKIGEIEFCISDNEPECKDVFNLDLFDNPPITDEDKEDPSEHIKIVRENIWEKSQKEVLEKYPEKMIMYYYAKLQKTIASGKKIVDIKSYFYTLLKKDNDDYGNIEAAELILKQKQIAEAEEKERLAKEAEAAKEKQDKSISLAEKYLGLLPPQVRDKYMFNKKIPTFLPGQLRKEAAAELLLRDNVDLFDKNPDIETFLTQYKRVGIG